MPLEPPALLSSLPVSGQTTAGDLLVEDEWQRLAKVSVEDVQRFVGKQVRIENGSVGSAEIFIGGVLSIFLRVIEVCFKLNKF